MIAGRAAACPARSQQHRRPGRRRGRLPHLAGDHYVAGTRLQRAWTRFRTAAALIATGIGDIAIGPVPRAGPTRGDPS